MSRETPSVVLQELASFIVETKAATGAALRGLREFRSSVQQLPLRPENPDPRMFFGEGDPNDPENAPWAVWRRSEALDRLAPAGPIDARLTQQWLVSLFTAWEHEYRPRLAAAHGFSSDTPLLYEPWGDIRKMRNDIVHHHGVVSPKNVGKCIELTWFSVGETISLRPRHFVALDRAYRWGEMARPPAAQNIGTRKSS